MSRRRRSENPVSLFPFVAVMASTMGALILLLLTMARQSAKARDAAAQQLGVEIKQAAEMESQALPDLVVLPELPSLPPHKLKPLVRCPTPVLPTITDPRSAIVARLKQIEQERADLKLRKERTPAPNQAGLAALLRETALVRHRLDALQAERRAAASQAEKVDIKIKGLTLEEKLALERRRRSPNQFAVIPYFGRQESARRPLYLECTADAVVLQPEGVRLSSDRLREASVHNPLRFCLEQMAEDAKRRFPTEPAPYPLLIVRPAGVETYYRVRSALEFLRFPFGYELVPEDFELAYPAADTRVRQVAEAAIQSAERWAQRQAELDMRIADRDNRDDPRTDQQSSSNAAKLQASQTSRQQAYGNTGGSYPTGSENVSDQKSAPNASRGGVDRLQTGGRRLLPEIGSSVEDFVAMHRSGPAARLGVGSLSVRADPIARADDAGEVNATASPRQMKEFLPGPQTEQAGDLGRGNRDRTSVRLPEDASEDEISPGSATSLLEKQALQSRKPRSLFSPLSTGVSAGGWNQDQSAANASTTNRGTQQTEMDQSATNGIWSANAGRAQGLDAKSDSTVDSHPDELAFDHAGSPSTAETVNANANQLLDAQGRFEQAANSLASPGPQPSTDEAPNGFRALKERSVYIICRFEEVVYSDGVTTSVRKDSHRDLLNVVRHVLTEAARWPAPQAGGAWRPTVVLQANASGGETMYALRGGLRSLGLSVRHEWIDELGIVLLSSQAGK